MAKIAEGIALWLADEGFGVYDETGTLSPTIYVDDQPRSPDACVTVTSTPGPPPSLGVGVDHPQFQIRCRGAEGTAEATEDQCEQIRERLHGLRTTLPDGTRVLRCAAQQSNPAWIGTDDHNRPEFTANFETDVRSLTGGRT